eukprot:1383871-Prymnesium_polylepis.1
MARTTVPRAAQPLDHSRPLPVREREGPRGRPLASQPVPSACDPAPAAAAAAARLLGLPRRQQVELAELLRQLHGLSDDAPLGGVVAALDEAAEWEILAQRVALEAVVGQDAPQVGVAREIYAVHVPRLALKPVGAGEEAGGGGDALLAEATHLRLDAHAAVVLDAQHL